MSKLDAQRAMREAKYARNQANAQSLGRTPPTRSPATPPVAPPEQGTGSAPPATGPAASASCGHKSMNGRACTRPAGHSEQSHRYS